MSGNRIVGTLGGNRVGTVGARLRNGDLGPSHSRLLAPRAVEDSPDFETAIDRLRTKEKGRMAALPDAPMVPELTATGQDRQRWTAEHVGLLVMGWMEGKTYEQIGMTIGRERQVVGKKLQAIRDGIQRMTFQARGAKGGAATRKTTKEQEEAIIAAIKRGVSTRVAATEAGITEGAARWLLEKARERKA